VDRRLGLRFDVLSECPLRVGCGLGGTGGTPFLKVSILVFGRNKAYLCKAEEGKGREGTHD
jgi:hypothetical protein